MGILSFFRRQKAAAPPAEDRAEKADMPRDVEKQERSPQSTESVISLSRVPANVLLRPVVTEKSSVLNAQGQYTFRVARGATKPQVRRTVERTYRVHVTGVRVVTVPPKTRQRGRITGEISGYRKAIVSIRDGERIDLTSGTA